MRTVRVSACEEVGGWAGGDCRGGKLRGVAGCYGGLRARLARRYVSELVDETESYAASPTVIKTGNKTLCLLRRMFTRPAFSKRV